MLTIDTIARDVNETALSFPVKKIDLFGSYAQGSQNEKSDVDLLVEFDDKSVSLLMLSELRLVLEDKLGIDVDLIHAPLPSDSLLSINKTVTLYER